MLIYCVACQSDVDARLTDGSEIYSHRPDLYDLPFWKCDACGNFVGCHHKTAQRTRPLGNIPTPLLREARKQIHAILDPIWKSGQRSRGSVYGQLSALLGCEYHTGEISSIEEARRIYVIVRDMARQGK